MTTLPTIGIVGTGKMGRPMAERLLEAGYTVVVHNRTPDKASPLIDAGAEDAGSCAGVAERADIIISSLTNQQSVRDVYFGSDGLVANAREGQLYIDTSTNDPDLVNEIASGLSAKDALFLDAPVSGGVAGATSGTLTIMAGGSQEALDRARPILDHLGQNIHHLGDVGTGTAMKLVNQLLVGINMAGVAEALVLGARAGASPQKVLEVIGTSFGGSRMLERGVPLIVDRNFEGGTPVDLIRKDLGIISDLATSLDMPLDLGREALSMFDRASESEFGAQDMTAVIRPIESAANTEVK